MAPTSKKYQCPMCFLDNSPVGFGRKSDFKKHLHNFHGSDVVWICRSKGCHLILLDGARVQHPCQRDASD